MEKTLIIGHRGAAGEAPENTLGSFLLAVEQGAHAIELDIHLSADGEIMVIHDHTIDRTTSGAGAVKDMTVSELQKVDAGVKFPDTYAGERIPTLEEVFDALPAHTLINVEIKSGRHEIEEKLVALMKRKNRMETVFVSSFDHKSLQVLKRLEPEVKIGLLYAVNFADHVKAAASVEEPVYSLHPAHHAIDDEDIRQAIASGLQVYPWTVNQEADMLRLLDCGVSGIITDFPGRLQALVAQRS